MKRKQKGEVVTFFILCVLGSAFLAGVGVGSEGKAVNKAELEKPALVAAAK